MSLSSASVPGPAPADAAPTQPSYGSRRGIDAEVAHYAVASEQHGPYHPGQTASDGALASAGTCVGEYSVRWPAPLLSRLPGTVPQPSVVPLPDDADVPPLPGFELPPGADESCMSWLPTGALPAAPPPPRDVDAPQESLWGLTGVQALPENVGCAPGVVPMPGDEDVPFDLAVLDEHPKLAQLILWLRQADRLVAQSLQRIEELGQDPSAVRATGVSLTGWMSVCGRRTVGDIRMLQASVRVLRRVPSLKAAFDAGQVSWAQVRSVVLAVQPLPSYLDDRIDAAVAEGILGVLGAEPEALTALIRLMLQDLRPQSAEDSEEEAEATEYLGMQAHKDGSGGRIWGEAGPIAWATLDAALNGDAPAPSAAGRDGFAGDPVGDGGSRSKREAGRDRLHRLLALLDATLEGGSARLDGAGPGADGPADGAVARAAAPDGQSRVYTDLAAWWARRCGSRPQVIIRAPLDMLLDRSQVPATLLTTLLGGAVTVSADTARQLIDLRGADLRTVVLNDTGEVVGVGRRTRVAPDWLRDAVLALHDTCAAPTCTTAARCCELDHAQPWTPARPDDAPGRTDIDQLAPLCRRDNAAKERDGWRATQQADGTRVWTHARAGIETSTIPATWRPPPGPSPPG